MTAENRTIITLSDLNAIEFECSTCRSRVFVSLSGDVFVPSGCPSPTCENQNWYTIGSQEHRELKILVDLLRRYGQNDSSKYKLRFEVKP